MLNEIDHVGNDLVLTQQGTVYRYAQSPSETDFEARYNMLASCGFLCRVYGIPELRLPGFVCGGGAMGAGVTTPSHTWPVILPARVSRYPQR